MTKRFTLLFAVMTLVTLACAVQVATPVMTAMPTETDTPEPVMTKSSTAEAWTAEVRLPTVNVRACAGCAEVLRTLRVGDAVTLVRCVYTPELGDWCQIKPRGWIYRGCLTINSGLGCSAK
jgi:hypothetical protein